MVTMDEVMNKVAEIMRKRMDSYLVDVFRDVNRVLTDEELEQIFHGLLEMLPKLASTFLDKFTIVPKLPQRLHVEYMGPPPVRDPDAFLKAIRERLEKELKIKMKPMTKEKMREYIESAEHGDALPSDLGKVALSLLKFFERHPEINPQKTCCINPETDEIKIDDVLDEQARKELDSLLPTRVMFEGALSSVKWILKKDEES